MRMFKKDEGFTLVELMVVVLIIGILVAVAIPIFNSASDSARVRTCQSNQRTIEGAIQQYNAANPTKSWSSTSLGLVFPYKITGTDAVLVAGANPYLKSAPKCPADWGDFYTINASGTVTSDGVTLITTGPGNSTASAHAHF